jgi:hypothetical protein
VPHNDQVNFRKAEPYRRNCLKSEATGMDDEILRFSLKKKDGVPGSKHLERPRLVFVTDRTCQHKNTVSLSKYVAV